MLIPRRRIVSLTITLVCACFTGALVCSANRVNAGENTSSPSAEVNVQQDDSKSAAPVKLQERQPRYRVEPGDVLVLDFPFTPEFNQTLTIQPDGFITLRTVGSFYAQGKTTPELEEQLCAAYSQVLHDPVITVDLTDFQKPYFIAGGQVAHPGKYDLRYGLTLTQAIEIAGGFNEKSKNSQVLLFHKISDKYFEVKKVDVKKMLGSANLQEDIYLRPGDMFYVPQNRISKVARFLPTSSMGMYFAPPVNY